MACTDEPGTASRKVTLVNRQLHLDGFIYTRSRVQKGRTYWDCRKLRAGECNGRAITSEPNSEGEVVIFKDPGLEGHEHAPNREEAAADVVRQTIKRKAASNPEQPPAQLLRTELTGVPQGVLSQLPDQPALSQAIRRTRRRNMPTNPTSLAAFRELPDRFKATLLGENFLMFDSGYDAEDEEDSDIEEDEGEVDCGRVLVFGTRKNIELLCRSHTWFLDGTFKTSPNIFVQIFTVLGLVQRAGRPDELTALPFVYALLPSKTTDAYATVIRAVRDASADFNVAQCHPGRIVTDFELSIINACREVYPQVPISCCFFHLGQSVYRKIQELGLQVPYNDPTDRTLKQFTHMMLSLAFVPISDIESVFDSLRAASPAALHPLFEYFETTYVRGRRAARRVRGQRASVPPRYPPTLWNMYEPALNKQHRTNNTSEGWHNRFRIVVGRHHPDLYACLIEFQKEQAFSESCLADLALGKRTKAAPKKQWTVLQERIQDIARDYQTHKANGTVMDYLRTLGHAINLS